MREVSTDEPWGLGMGEASSRVILLLCREDRARAVDTVVVVQLVVFEVVLLRLVCGGMDAHARKHLRPR